VSQNLKKWVLKGARLKLFKKKLKWVSQRCLKVRQFFWKRALKGGR
jgi:hypothetical protein